MADTGDSLDDFFAKKDKRKKGKGKKFATSNSIAKTIEASQAPPPEPEKKDTKIDIPNAPTRDDEWKEEEEVVQDLEGLKIQSLNLESEEVPEKVSDVQTEAGEQDDDAVKASMSPWQNKGATQQQETQQPQPPQQPQQPPQETEKKGAYVPPGLRGKQTPTARHSSRRPPDIQNPQAFPSLSASTQIAPKTKDKDFTEVRGTRGTRGGDATYDAPGIELTNKYGSLRNN